MKKDKFFDAVENAPAFPKGQRADLAAMLMSEPMLAALGEVIRDKDLAAEQFRGLNFTTQDGVAKAIRLQGMGDGVIFVLEHLADLVSEEEEDNDG